MVDDFKLELGPTRNLGPTFPELGIKGDLSHQHLAGLQRHCAGVIYGESAWRFGDRTCLAVGIGPLNRNVAVAPGVPLFEMALRLVADVFDDGM